MRTFALPPGPFRAVRTVPGDKSLSHRALLLAGMASGVSLIRHLSPGADVAATRRALQGLGVEMHGEEVRSPGVEAWKAPGGPIDAGNSGTTLRLLSGALAARPFSSTVVGDASLMRRPMGPLGAALSALGAHVALGPGERPPVTVGNSVLRGAEVRIPEASAQVRSAVALAALQAEGPTMISSPPGFRDHTERWLEAMGLGRRLAESRFVVLPGPVLPGTYDLPGDLSSAAFLLVAAALRPGAELTVRSVTLNPGRTGFLDVLESMGASVARTATGLIRGDPIGDVSVSAAPLHGVRLSGPLAVRALDELPLVGLLAAAAAGETVVSGAAALRAKESDRIAATVRLARAVGAAAEERPDGFVVLGSRLRPGGSVDAGGDHRIAMAGAVAAVAADGEFGVAGYEAVEASWPGFGEALEGLWS